MQARRRQSLRLVLAKLRFGFLIEEGLLEQQSLESELGLIVLLGSCMSSIGRRKWLHSWGFTPGRLLQHSACVVIPA